MQWLALPPHYGVLIRRSASGTPEQKDFREKLKKLREELESIVKELKGEIVPKAVLELYEIDITPKGTILRRVNVQ